MKIIVANGPGPCIARAAGASAAGDCPAEGTPPHQPHTSHQHHQYAPDLATMATRGPRTPSAGGSCATSRQRTAVAGGRPARDCPNNAEQDVISAVHTPNGGCRNRLIWLHPSSLSGLSSANSIPPRRSRVRPVSRVTLSTDFGVYPGAWQRPDWRAGGRGSLSRAGAFRLAAHCGCYRSRPAAGDRPNPLKFAPPAPCAGR